MAWGEAQTPEDETGLADREDVDRGVGVGEEGVGVARPLAPPPAPPSTSSSSASSGESDVGASPSPDHQVALILGLFFWPGLAVHSRGEEARRAPTALSPSG
ncbi:hypothetical protein OTU49_009486 [Cherax quadricarinatus]|uniref:Uncharacterized protein n=1 Tax=Cherax quadricarinatus TaxID=27406 RepID=A0AAW0WAA4_CHEQU